MTKDNDSREATGNPSKTLRIFIGIQIALSILAIAVGLFGLRTSRVYDERNQLRAQLDAQSRELHNARAQLGRAKEIIERLPASQDLLNELTGGPGDDVEPPDQ